MSRVCAVSRKKPQFGNTVSHSNRKTRTRFNPNLQRCSFPSEILGKPVRLRLTANGIRTVEKRGGIDRFLLNARPAELSGELKALKRRLKTVQAKKK